MDYNNMMIMENEVREVEYNRIESVYTCLKRYEDVVHRIKTSEDKRLMVHGNVLCEVLHDKFGLSYDDIEAYYLSFSCNAA